MRKSFLTILVIIAILVSVCFLIGACKKEQDTKGLHLLAQEIPAGWPAPILTYSDNPLTQEGFELGRKLFYDGRLSIDNDHACSSCHQQIAVFGTYQHDLSHGVNGSHTLRNAPGLFNLAWSSSFNWNGRYTTLEDEAADKIHGRIEMGEGYDGIINKLTKDKEYRDQFKKVFGSPFIQPQFILKALSQFTGFMVSANSKYDKYKQGSASFTVQEERGYQLYKASCATCHPEPLFTDYSFRNIGLPLDPFLNDLGRMAKNTAALNPLDSLKFKVPTLRNTYISSNYMHDGRFNTLLQCIGHYRTGVKQSATLDPLLTNGIQLTDAQALDIAIFLRALTDSSFLQDPRFREQ